MLIFGSTAARHWIPDFRTPNDLDYLGVGKSSKGIEYHWCDAMQYVVDNNVDKVYVDLDYLYTIKLSHVPFNDRKRITHLKDIDVMKKAGARVDVKLYDMLWSEWEDRFGKKSVNFSTPNKYFFKETIDRVIEHDTLHERLAFYKAPMHTLIRYNDESPYCSEILFDRLSYDDKIITVLEELWVIATERFLLKDRRTSFQLAKVKSLDKLITSLTKGWFNRFICENAVYIMSCCGDTDKVFINKIKEIKDEFRIS